MATMIPNTPPGPMTPEIARVFRSVKSLPDELYTAWLRLGAADHPCPEFLLVRRDRRAALIKVSGATKQEARSVIQPELLPIRASSSPFASLEEEAIREFHSRLFPALQHEGPASVIVFPNLRKPDLMAARADPIPQANVWLSADDLNPERLQQALDRTLSNPLDEREIEALRETFAPEVQIPRQFTVRAPIERNTDAEFTQYLLDLDQEWLLKVDLDLSDEAQRTSKDFSLRLVNGVAGSGKSLILVYRAKLLRQLFPKKKILALTHNKPLIQDLEERYKLLTDGDDSVEWRTFYSWCYSLLPNSVVLETPLGADRRMRLISAIHQRHLADTAVTPEMLELEIDWFKDRLYTKRSDYLSADRTGRGFALQESMRNRLFDAMQEYQECLSEQGSLDWGDIPRRIWQMMEHGEISDVEYDVILIDEAQFFAPIWFEIIKRVLKSATGHLFIVADPTQGFLRRGESWLASGLEVRGRSHRLDKSYRTTREILDFATWLYRNRIHFEDEEIVAPDMLGMPSGDVPVVVPVTTPQDEITRVVNEVVQVARSGMPLKDILVIHATWQGVDTLIARLSAELGEKSVIDPKESGARDRIRVCTLNAATGLESPIVFLVGFRSLQERELSLRISEEDRMELIRDNTRKVYMAVTRAGQRLVMTYCGEVPDWLRRARSPTGADDR